MQAAFARQLQASLQPYVPSLPPCGVRGHLSPAACCWWPDLGPALALAAAPAPAPAPAPTSTLSPDPDANQAQLGTRHLALSLSLDPNPKQAQLDTRVLPALLAQQESLGHLRLGTQAPYLLLLNNNYLPLSCLLFTHWPPAPRNAGGLRAPRAADAGMLLEKHLESQ